MKLKNLILESSLMIPSDILDKHKNNSKLPVKRNKNTITLNGKSFYSYDRELLKIIEKVESDINDNRDDLNDSFSMDTYECIIYDIDKDVFILISAGAWDWEEFDDMDEPLDSGTTYDTVLIWLTFNGKFNLKHYELTGNGTGADTHGIPRTIASIKNLKNFVRLK